MKKVLIYKIEEELGPVGGPLGYIYNIKNQLGYGKEELQISYLHSTTASNAKKQTIQKITGMKNGKIKTMLTIAKSIYKKEMLMHGLKHKAMTDLSEYDLVHFHSTLDMYAARDDLQKYNGVVVLTSHSPKVTYEQVMDYTSDFEKKYFGKSYKKLIKMDEFAFERADYIVFPCEEAEEPYYHTWPAYAELRSKSRNKLRYLPTGTSVLKAKVHDREIRDRYHIPQDAFVFSYVGRHNEVKGYDILKKIAAELIKRHNNVYFLVAGVEEPLKRYDHAQWIEVGWTNDPGSVILAGNVFILPNRETYFDLVLLEVLSMGQVVLASATGGNKFFRRFGENGILLYDTVEDAVHKAERLINMPNAELDQLRSQNIMLYQKNFTNEIFAQNYFNLLTELSGAIEQVGG